MSLAPLQLYCASLLRQAHVRFPHREFSMPFGPHLSHEELRAMPSRRISIGVLPVIVPRQVAAGYGAGEPSSSARTPGDHFRAS